MLKGIRRVALTAFGVVGAAITLFAALQTVFPSVDWARQRAAGWQGSTRSFWVWFSSPLNVQPPDWLASVLTIAACLFIAMLGVRHSPDQGDKTSPAYPYIHPFGAVGEVVCLFVILAIMQRWGTNNAWTMPTPLLQFAVLCLVFGLLGTISPNGFIKRVWMMLLTVAVLLAASELLKRTDMRSFGKAIPRLDRQPPLHLAGRKQQQLRLRSENSTLLPPACTPCAVLRRS